MRKVSDIIIGMSMNDERKGGWGRPLFLAAMMFFAYLLYNFGAWMIYGYQTAGSSRDIVISFIPETPEEYRELKDTIGYFVDIDQKLIFMERNDFSKSSNKLAVLNVFSPNKKKVIEKRKLTDEDIDFLLEIAEPNYEPASSKLRSGQKYLEGMQQIKLEFDTEMVDDYGKTVQVYRCDIEKILDKVSAY